MTPKFQFVANGLYEAPFGINVAANLLIRQGYGQPYYQEIALKDVLLVPDVGDNRLQAIESFDLRVGTAFRVNGITMNVDLDWFNVDREFRPAGVPGQRHHDECRPRCSADSMTPGRKPSRNPTRRRRGFMISNLRLPQL